MYIHLYGFAHYKNIYIFLISLLTTEANIFCSFKIID
jgi:hypothetical protein